MEKTQDQKIVENHSTTETSNHLNPAPTTTENNQDELAESNQDLESLSPQPVIRGRPTLSEVDNAEDIPF